MSTQRPIAVKGRQVEAYVDGHWVMFTDVASGRRISGGISQPLKEPPDNQLLAALDELMENRARHREG